MAFTVKINGFEVVAETVDEVRALVGLGAPASPAPSPSQAPQPPARAEVSLAVRKLPKGCVTPNGRGFRWQFSWRGVRYTGPTVPGEDEARAGLALALRELAETGRPPVVELVGPMVGQDYDAATWRDVHKFDKRMQAALRELEELRPHFDVLPAAMRQAVEARLSGAYPAQIAQALGKKATTVSQALWDARLKLRAAAKAAAACPPAVEVPPPPEPAAVPPPTAEAAAPPAPPVRNRQKTCGICGEVGHNSRRHRSPPDSDPPATDGASDEPEKQEAPAAPVAADAFPDASALGEIAEIERSMFDRARRKPPLIRRDIPPEHPVVVAVDGAERVGLEVGADAKTVTVRWLAGPGTWAAEAVTVPRADVLRDATLEEQGIAAPDDIAEDAA